MPRRTTLFLPALILLFTTGTANAKTLQTISPVQSGTCALTCATRQTDNTWKSDTQCFEHMSKTRCSTLATHRNNNDAYPYRFKCQAKLETPCTAHRD